MSTRGSFIIKRDNIDKELYIPADAYPGGAGRDVVRLVKSLDINNMYDLLKTEEDLLEEVDYIPCVEPRDFELEKMVSSVRNERVYVYQDVGRWFIQDSLICEYAYVIDLDEKRLLFYVGFQKEPQAGNRYGTEQQNGYYPCALKAIFNFAFIRQNSTPAIVELMQEAQKSSEIQCFEADTLETPEEKKSEGMRQLIIARKDLQMSPGKLAAQVSHASMAFIADMLRKGGVDEELSMDTCDVAAYHISVTMSPDIYNNWLNGIFTKTICEARNRNHLMKAIIMAEELGLQEGKDFFLIKDNCLTELEPEEYDENGTGRTLTCVGFRPLPDSIAHQISKKYQLYR